ncbi:MAG: T9SS type A sorting domain-containing protein [Flavobacteriales bacterium]
MRRIFIPAVTILHALIISFCGNAQSTKRVLFIGNSYIYTNDLPAILEQIATNMGDTLIYDASTPGGYSFAQHLNNAITISKIEAGNWDYVILQEQSQIPSFPIEQVEEDCFPFAADLCELIELNNPCAEIMFFMTWGRENGDSQNCVNWPPVCTYEGMDDLLHERYMMMADQNDALVGAVGAVWRYIRDNNTEIELYSADQSHPSLTGSYAAAVCFYASIFRKDPEDIMYNEGVGEGDASFIRSTVKSVVYDHFEDWSIGTYDPVANMEWQEISELEFQFTNTSTNAETSQISFQGNTWEEWNESVVHTFSGPGMYTMGVIAISCGVADTNYYDLQVGPVNIETLDAMIRVFPNPASDVLYIKSSWSDIEYQQIEILDAKGSKVLSNVPRNQRLIELHLTTLNEGVYTVLVMTNAGTISQRLVIIR